MAALPGHTRKCTQANDNTDKYTINIEIFLISKKLGSAIKPIRGLY